MAREGWFDKKGMDLFKIGLRGRKEDWRRYAKDGVISIDEIKERFEVVKKRLKKLEPKLSDKLHKEVTELLLDYELLNKMIAYHVCTEGCSPILR